MEEDAYPPTSRPLVTRRPIFAIFGPHSGPRKIELLLVLHVSLHALIYNALQEHIGLEENHELSSQTSHV